MVFNTEIKQKHGRIIIHPFDILLNENSIQTPKHINQGKNNENNTLSHYKQCGWHCQSFSFTRIEADGENLGLF